VISEWSRSALQASSNASKSTGKKSSSMSQSEIDKQFYDLGFRTLPNREGVVVTNELINRIRDEEGI
jgi:hypothetical protein